jgi:hypothetical protein
MGTILTLLASGLTALFALAALPDAWQDAPVLAAVASLAALVAILAYPRWASLERTMLVTLGWLGETPRPRYAGQDPTRVGSSATDA